MQTDTKNGAKRDWRTHVMEGRNRGTKPAWELALIFREAQMSGDVLGEAEDAPQPFTRHCIIKVAEGRYLVEHRDEGRSSKYMCVEFVSLGDVVVQVRESKQIKHISPKLCSDHNMATSPWLVVDWRGLFQSRVKCPLQGGFSAKIYDKERDADVCGAFEGSTRVESECMQEEGMFFRFRHDSCVPRELHMHRQQQVFCAAHWERHGFTFTIVRSSRDAWCFRFPTDNNGAFHGILFRDVRCDEEEIPRAMNRYFRIALIQDAPRSLSDLCVDDYEACSYWNSPCIHAGSLMQLTCAKLCGICSSEIPNTSCILPRSLHGRWREQRPNASTLLDLRDLHLTIEGLAHFRCVQWYQRPYEHDMSKYEQMLVTTFKNGCRPRYTCAQFSRHSPSVLKFKLSQSEIWPWEGTTGVTVSCHPFKYKDDSSEFRSSRLKIFLSEEQERVHVNCERPFVVTRFIAKQADGSTCAGEFQSSSNFDFKMQFSNCSGLPDHFACLDSSHHGPLGDHLLVAEVVADPKRSVVCWLFSSDPQEPFYLINIEDCNGGSKELILTGDLQPLVTFLPWLPTATTVAPFAEAVAKTIIYNSSTSDRTADNGTAEWMVRSGQEGYRIQDEGGQAVVSKDSSAARGQHLTSGFLLVSMLFHFIVFS